MLNEDSIWKRQSPSSNSDPWKDNSYCISTSRSSKYTEKTFLKDRPDYFEDESEYSDKPFEVDDYKINLKNIFSDPRTTLMIRNIPNKYTSKLLREKINISFRDKYDFFYLPMDFKHKCNYGYAFINLKSQAEILNFYQEMNHKKWEYFKSNKICEIKYARIQGKNELEKHFKHTNALNSMKNDLQNFILP